MEITTWREVSFKRALDYGYAIDPTKLNEVHLAELSLWSCFLRENPPKATNGLWGLLFLGL